MERVSRILVFVALFGLIYFGFTRFGGGNKGVVQPLRPEIVLAPSGERPAEQRCDLWTAEFRAQTSSRGAVLKHLEPLAAKYRKHGQRLDLVTTPDHPQLSPLFTSLRPRGSGQEQTALVATDVLDFQLKAATATSCTFEYADAHVSLVKTFRVAKDVPYGLHVSLQIKNIDATPRSYALTASTSAYLEDKLVASKMFRTNPLTSRVECFGESGQARREGVDDFAADDFEDAERFPKSAHNSGQWSEPTGAASLVAVSNAYFTNAIAPQKAPVAAVCQLQIEERWDPRAGSKSDDPHAAAIYKARLTYPDRILAPGQTDQYEFKAFVGPKERAALNASGERFEPIIDLGFFSVIAKVLVAFLLKVYSFIPNWGVAIVLLTITARLLLFPLSVPSIKNMIQMRELKPEMDKLNEKYKDDPQAKGLAQMALWKKHGVNPMKGCLPQLASMPVWFALYTTLQTAVELYNIPFLWFPDLSESDPYYILPFVIGAVFFVQQRLTPMQGDPAQQKMMMYLMPGMFTVFMLFLPAGLGVYMFTNSLLGIVQQRVVEAHVKRSIASARADVVDTEGHSLEDPSTSKKAKRSS